MLFNVSISTQSRLATLLSTLFARCGSFYRLYDGSDLKTYLLMRWQGPDVLAVVRPTGVYLLALFWFSVLFTVESLSLLYLLFIS